MPVSALHIPGALVVNGSGVTTFSGVFERSIDTGIQEVVNFPAGATLPTFAAKVFAAPTVRFTTTDIVDIWNVFQIPTSTIITSIDLFFAAMDSSGTVKSGSNHSRVRCTKALGLLRSIEVENGQEARATIELMPVYDGTNAILAYTASVALPTPATLVKYTMGPVKIDGTDLEATGWTYEPQYSEIRAAASGDTNPTFICYNERQPRFRVRGARNFANWVSFHDFGSLTSFAAYLRKLNNLATASADADEDNISFALGSAEGARLGRSLSGSDRQPIDTEFEVIAVTAPTISTDVAVS